MNEKNILDKVGQIQIADEVIAIIAGLTATEIDGVLGMAGNITGEIAEILGKKNLSKGVKVEVGEKEVIVDLNVVLKFGVKIPQVAEEVQKKVKSAIETMSGLDVVEVNVNVMGVNFDKSKIQAEVKKTN